MRYCNSDTASSAGMGWSGVFHLYVRAGKAECFADQRGFFFKEHQHIFSRRQLVQESLTKSLFCTQMCMSMCVCACACQPITPCPSISMSLPLPCPLKTSNVFFAQLCAGLCVQACVAFPLSCIQSQQQPHTRTTLPCSLRPQLTH